jgi:glycosyltransferase involved in cell wall biosynthesis
VRIAVAHHWFVTRGGGERVAECIAALFPRAEMFTLVHSPAGTPQSLRTRRWHGSVLQRLPLARTHHRHFLPLYPQAAESLDARGFDLVLSSDSGPIKGLRMDPGAKQICYCHSPMRYLWDGYEQYRAAMGTLTATAFAATAPRVRAWDRKAAERVDWFVANSRYVADRIARCYGREAAVVHPPIDLHRADELRGETPGDSYLCAGRLVSYKRTEILIEACRKLNRKLRVVGAGPELEKLKTLTAGDPRIVFTGEVSSAELWREFARCRALLFAADEDFGMIPLEAQACGRPVIAYGAGGSLETVRDDVTGTYFAEQNAASAAEAIERFERELAPGFDPEEARRWAAEFATPLFLERYRALVLAHVPAAASEAVSVAEAMEALR